MNLLRTLWSGTAGASAAEYALILAIMGTGIAAAAYALGGSISLAMENTGNALSACGGIC